MCLNVGCIPSKALLHLAQVIHEAEECARFGVGFAKPAIDPDKIRDWKNQVVRTLTTGLAALAKQRKVTVVQGVGRFASERAMTVTTAEGEQTIGFDACIIAAGSQPAKVPGFPYDDPRLMDSTAALEIPAIPKRLLIVGVASSAWRWRPCTMPSVRRSPWWS